MILGARLELEGLAKFLLRLRHLSHVHQRHAEIVVAEAGLWIERHRLAQNFEGFLILPARSRA